MPRAKSAVRPVAYLLMACVVVACFSITVAGGQTPAQAATYTSQGKIQYWNVSLKLVRCTEDANCNGDWKRFFVRASEYEFYPDIISVLEAPWQKRDEVMAQVTANLGGGWQYIHVDANQACAVQDLEPCGNTMIVYRSAKFSETNAAGESQVRRFRQYRDGDGSTVCTDHEFETRDQTPAVKFREIPSGRQVVVAAVHFPPNDSEHCMEKNLQHLNDRLNAEWSTRPLTIVSGDFNLKPDTTSSDAEAKRREENKMCWYRMWSGRSDPTSCSVAYQFNVHYYDGLLETHDGTPATICGQWTFNNFNQDANSDQCDGRHSRIDYIWLRWETNGVAQRPSPAEVDQRLGGNTDRGFEPAMNDWYSDHRALRVLVSWW